MSNYGLDFVYRADLPALIARWQREITPQELQAGYQAVRAAADEARCSRWLLDLRRREDVIEPAVNAWFGTTFAPSLRGRYAAPVRLVFLVSPLRAQRPATAPVLTANADCRIANFTDEASAHAWLALSES